MEKHCQKLDQMTGLNELNACEVATQTGIIWG